MSAYRVLEGDCIDVLKTLDAGSVQTCVTSPPYWGLRDYGEAGQLGLEPTPDDYVRNLVDVFREVRRVLRDDGTVFLNLGDSYASSPPGNTTKGVSGKSTLHGVDGESGRYRDTLSQSVQTKRSTIVDGLKPKDLVGIPWSVAFALRADGWWLRSDIIWAKPNPMPESVTDRPTRSHEYLFLLTKGARYYFDADAIREEDSGLPAGNGFLGRQGGSERYGDALTGLGSPGTEERWTPGGGRNKRSVWTVATQPYAGAHFATFPPKLIEPCVLAGSAPDDVVLDPFCGAGTTGVVALRHNRDFVGIELSPEYARMARDRIYDDGPLLNREGSPPGERPKRGQKWTLMDISTATRTCRRKTKRGLRAISTPRQSRTN